MSELVLGFIVLVLIILIVFQNYWFYLQIDKLTNKIMSRNFAEYRESLSTQPEPPETLKVPLPSQEEEDYLKLLNGVIGG